MTRRRFNVLFVGRENSARSLTAESLLNRWGEGKSHALRAGNHPKGAV